MSDKERELVEKVCKWIGIDVLEEIEVTPNKGIVIEIGEPDISKMIKTALDL